jgi:hypothetical protein
MLKGILSQKSILIDQIARGEASDHINSEFCNFQVAGVKSPSHQFAGAEFPFWACPSRQQSPVSAAPAIL